MTEKAASESELRKLAEQKSVPEFRACRSVELIPDRFREQPVRYNDVHAGINPWDFAHSCGICAHVAFRSDGITAFRQQKQMQIVRERVQPTAIPDAVQ